MLTVQSGSPCSQPTPSFTQVMKDNDLMERIEIIFQRILVPLYGPQDDALEKIKLGQDRLCYLLTENEETVGVIVFKKILSNEFATFGIQNSIEIKSLFVVDGERRSGRGLGSILFNKIVEESEKLHINHSSFHVTVSETKQESLNFFIKKGFKQVHVWEGRYKSGTNEYLLHCPLENLITPAQQRAERTNNIFTNLHRLTEKQNEKASEEST